MCIYVVVPNIIPLEPMGLLRYQFQSFTTNVWGVFLSTGSLQSLPLQKSFSKAQLSHESGDVHLEKKNIHSSPQKRTNLPTIPSRKRFVSSKLQKTTDFFDHQKGWTDLKMMFSLKKNGKKKLGIYPPTRDASHHRDCYHSNRLFHNLLPEDLEQKAPLFWICKFWPEKMASLRSQPHENLPRLKVVTFAPLLRPRIATLHGLWRWQHLRISDKIATFPLLKATLCRFLESKKRAHRNSRRFYSEKARRKLFPCVSGGFRKKEVNLIEHIDNINIQSLIISLQRSIVKRIPWIFWYSESEIPLILVPTRWLQAKNYSIFTLFVNEHSNGISPCLIGNTSSEGPWFYCYAGLPECI